MISIAKKIENTLNSLEFQCHLQISFNLTYLSDLSDNKKKKQMTILVDYESFESESDKSGPILGEPVRKECDQGLDEVKGNGQLAGKLFNQSIVYHNIHIKIFNFTRLLQYSHKKKRNFQ